MQHLMLPAQKKKQNFLFFTFHSIGFILPRLRPTDADMRIRRTRCAASIFVNNIMDLMEDQAGVSACSEARSFFVALFSWPQAAMISRPRGVRTGEA